MFKLVKINKKEVIVNSDNQLVYTPPTFITYNKKHDLNKLVEALNRKGYRDVEDIMSFERGHLK